MSRMPDSIPARRRALLEWVIDSVRPPADDAYAGAHWQLNHARLALGRDLEAANRYFEAVELDPRPRVWKDGTSDTVDWDFPGTNLLRTLLDFQGSDRLGAAARSRLAAIFTGWEQPRKGENRDNNRVHRYAAIHTENHDIMCLTIGLFGEVLAGRDGRGHVGELARSLSWRFRRGWTEWHSPCYQVHYLNPLLILADHAPDEALRSAARELVNVQLAERAALSVRGYLGGPFYRGYDQHIANDRRDGYLPVIWQAFGLPDSTDGLAAEGLHFASSRFEPHPAVLELAAMPAATPVAFHRGTRDCSRRREHPPRTVCYWNSRHVSMGSMRAFDQGHQPRFFNVMFADEPSRSLRTYLRDASEPSPWDPRHERGELVQHGNWLVSRGELVAEGGLAPEPAGPFSLYRSGRGLCAHCRVGADLHVFQTGDLELYTDERDFLSRLSVPELRDGRLRARTAAGEELAVDPADMSIEVDGRPGHDWSDRLHAGPWLHADWDSGSIEVRTGAESGRAVFSDRAIRRLIPAPEASA